MKTVTYYGLRTVETKEIIGFDIWPEPTCGGDTSEISWLLDINPEVVFISNDKSRAQKLITNETAYGSYDFPLVSSSLLKFDLEIYEIEVPVKE
jgi:hypothetical protein